MNLRANVNKNTCIGCGICIDICPNIFEFDPQGLSESTLTAIEPAHGDCVRNAAKACPTNAISVQ